VAAVDLQQRLEKLREIRASGERRVRIGNEEVEFRSDSELRAAISDLERQIAASDGRIARTIRFKMHQGF